MCIIYYFIMVINKLFHFHLKFSVITPYNRLSGRQLTVLKTDQMKIVGKRVGENFLFVKIKK